MPTYVKNHIFIACAISLAAFGVARWAGCPVPFLALIAGGLFYTVREKIQSDLVDRQGWLAPLSVTAVLTVLGFVAQLGGLL